ncbi:MAG: hypothetical protein PHP03_00930 [Candidatus Pacebacteria bacterium]|nr:hypothetical protein [Candidatus Paceibacterota bacterium]
MFFNNKNSRGVVLVEILIYTAILGVSGALLGGIFTNTQRISNRQTASNEVVSQMNFISQTIQKYVRSSSLIDVASTTSETILSLRMQDETTGSTTIYASGGTVYIRQGTAAPVPLSNEKVTVSQLEFTKISSPKAHDSVLVDMTVEYNSENSQLTFSKTLTSIIGRVNAAVFDSDLVPGANDTYSLGLTTPRAWKNAYFSGNVGIGTVAPSEGLHILNKDVLITQDSGGTGDTDVIVSSYSNKPAIRLKYGGSDVFSIKNGGYGVDFGIYEDNSTARLYIKDGGNVGIGTTTPLTVLSMIGVKDAATLRISSSGSFTNTTGGDNLGAISFFSNEGSNASSVGEMSRIQSISGPGDWDGGGGTPGHIAFLTTPSNTPGSTPTEKMRITNAGNVGVGTTTPASILHVVGTTPTVTIGSGNSGSTAGKLVVNMYTAGMARPITLDAGANLISQPSTLAIQGNNLTLKYHNGSAYAAGVTLAQTSGFVGIGTTTPVAALTLARSDQDSMLRIIARAEQNIYHVSLSENYDPTASFTITQRSNVILQSNFDGSNIVLMPSSGNVGIGTTDTGSYKLHVNGSVKTEGVVQFGYTKIYETNSATGQSCDDRCNDSYVSGQCIKAFTYEAQQQAKACSTTGNSVCLCAAGNY